LGGLGKKMHKVLKVQGTRGTEECTIQKGEKKVGEEKKQRTRMKNKKGRGLTADRASSFTAWLYKGSRHFERTWMYRGEGKKRHMAKR